MARSARTLVALAGSAAALVALTGCVTTQQRSDRAQIVATRLLTSRHAVRIARPDPALRVGEVSLVRGAGGTAIVVALTNTSARSLTDVPVAVGVVSHGRRRLLNARPNPDYFETHVASIAPRQTIHWVFTTTRRVRASARPFATAGAPAHPPVATAGTSLPVIQAAATNGAARTVRVRLDSRTDVPQYGLPVYVLARRGARLVGAGRLTLAHLGTAGQATVAVPLVGAASGASLDAQALPSIFH